MLGLLVPAPLDDLIFFFPPDTTTSREEQLQARVGHLRDHWSNGSRYTRSRRRREPRGMRREGRRGSRREAKELATRSDWRAKMVRVPAANHRSTGIIIDCDRSIGIQSELARKMAPLYRNIKNQTSQRMLRFNYFFSS